jgi:RES domain
MPAPGLIPDAYFRKEIGRLRVAPGQRWLDLRSTATHQALRVELADVLVELGYERRFVWGDLLSHDHRLTQAVTAWADDRGYHGIAYASCHGAAADCWALFDRAIFAPVGEPDSVQQDDPDLIAVADLFDLTIP